MHKGRRGLPGYRSILAIGAAGVVASALVMGGCQPAGYRKDADKVAGGILKARQREALGRGEPFAIETPADTLRRRLQIAQNLPNSGPEAVGTDVLPRIKHWPEKNYPARGDDPGGHVVEATAEPVRLSLVQALEVAAGNSREYQTRKEQVFTAALDLDLEDHEFRTTFTGLLESVVSTDHATGKPVTGVENSASLGVSKRLRSGAQLTGRIGLDLVKLLSAPGASSSGILADATITVPLLRGSGRYIVAEPLTQAERNVVYAFWDFERFKDTFTIGIVNDYLSVLQAADQIANATENYKSQVISARRSQALFQEDRLSQVQLDQARQAELNARDQWVQARKRHADAMDRFKQTLGLPTDAAVGLDESELKVLEQTHASLGTSRELVKREAEVPSADTPVALREPSREGAGPYEIEESRAIVTALDHRPDLRTQKGRVYDAQRKVVVAADALRAELTLRGDAASGQSRSLGEAHLPNAHLRPGRGFYSAGVSLDLPLDRVVERDEYRRSYITLEKSVRDVQEVEDKIKLDVREGLRRLLQARESYSINRVGYELARQRVDQTTAFFELGREGVQIRDVLEAQADLLRARNAVSSSLVAYRVAELELQSDMGVLVVNEKGLFNEYDPSRAN